MDLAEGKTPFYQEDARLSIVALPLPVKDKAGISLFGAFPSDSFKVLAGGPAEAVVIMANARNRISYFKRIPFHGSTLAEASVFFDEAVGLPPGEYDCRMVVYHLETGRGVSAATTVIIPKRHSRPGHQRSIPPICSSKAPSRAITGMSARSARPIRSERDRGCP